jgi:hypothetical protein
VHTLSRGAANKIDSFEWKVLQKISGPTVPNGVWKIRYNDDMYKMYKDVALSNIYNFKEINAGWPHCKNGTLYPKEGTRKLFCRRKASGETTK